MRNNRDGFSSRFGIIAAAAGSAVGLGNIWRFPYTVGENGGGAFLLLYLVFIFLIGIPLMLTELSLGRGAQRNAFGTFKTLGSSNKWGVVGLIGVVAAFIILSFYSAVAGWVLEYTAQAVKNGFAGKDPTAIADMFKGLSDMPFRTVAWMLLFMAMTAGIVTAGIKKGIEKYTKILMPLLLVIVVILSVRAVLLPGAFEGVKFLFKPDFSKISKNSVLEAMGQAFFSLSLGMGTIITYGSYVKKDVKMIGTATTVSLADTLVAVLAGIAIFPAVFAFGIKPDSGPELVFVTLPIVFQQMAGGYIFSVVFFLLMTIAALTSSISLLEVVVIYFSEELKMTRKAATWLATSTISIFGVLCSLSSGVLSEFTVFGQTVFMLFNYISSNILLPLGGVMITIFAGWHVKKRILKGEIVNSEMEGRLFGIYIKLLKYFVPVVITLVFLRGIGLL